MANNIYQTLSKIDVSKDIRSKNGNSYLPWATCWRIVKEHYPDSVYLINRQPFFAYDGNGNKLTQFDRPWFSANGSGWVEVEVCIGDENERVSHTETYPIMDLRNKAIAEDSITTMEVNKALKRALVKAVATCTGLGLHLFYGEDLPVELAEITDAHNRIHELAKKKMELSEKAKARVIELMKDAERKTNPDLTDEEITGRVTNIDDIDVLRDLEKKLLAIRK